MRDAWDIVFFFSSRRRHTRSTRDWSSDVCSSDLKGGRVQGWKIPGNAGYPRLGCKIPSSILPPFILPSLSLPYCSILYHFLPPPFLHCLHPFPPSPFFPTSLTHLLRSSPLPSPPPPPPP